MRSLTVVGHQIGNTFWGTYALEKYVCGRGARALCAPGRTSSRLFCSRLLSFWYQSQNWLSVVAPFPPRRFARAGQSFPQAAPEPHSALTVGWQLSIGRINEQRRKRLTLRALV